MPRNRIHDLRLCQDYVVKGHAEMVVVIDPIGDHTLHRADAGAPSGWMDCVICNLCLWVCGIYPTSEAVYTCVNV